MNAAFTLQYIHHAHSPCHCGCTTHWEPLGTDKHPKLGVNIRNFEPSVMGNVRIRLLDGAKTWNYVEWNGERGG